MLNNKENLNRFVLKHNQYFEIALKEIKNGKKESHWMWFIFPQIVGLGESNIAYYYAIKSKQEALDYLSNDILYSHLIECCKALIALEEKNPSKIFSYPDDLKLRSSLTLFYEISKNQIFLDVINQYYDGELDQRTIQILKELEKH